MESGGPWQEPNFNCLTTPKRIGCVVSVSSNFKLKFVSKRSKNDLKKNVGEFSRPENSAVFKLNFFPRDSRSYV